MANSFRSMVLWAWSSRVLVAGLSRGSRTAYHPPLSSRPPRLLGLQPASHARAIGGPSGGGDVVHKVAQPLTQGEHAQAFALACPVPQGVQLGAERLAERGRDGGEFLREFEERVAQASAE